MAMKLVWMLVCTTLISGIDCLAANRWAGTKANVQLVVQDDNGSPVRNAKVEDHFESPYSKDYVGEQFDLRTNADGLCVISGLGFSELKGRITAPNHYATYFTLQLGDRKEAAKSGRWQLTSHTIVLKAVRNPVAMYVRRLNIVLVKENPGTAIGYDFVFGDWTPPHGKGLHRDIVFRFQRNVFRSEKIVQKARPDDVRKPDDRVIEIPMDYDESYSVEMPNRGDGLIRTRMDESSQLLSSHQAPEDGYQPSICLFSRLRKEKRGWEGKYETDIDRNALYYIRVRTELDEGGNVERAWYGKIYGEYDGGVKFYVNPDGTRNVEFDPMKNLFGKMSSLDEVRDP